MTFKLPDCLGVFEIDRKISLNGFNETKTKLMVILYESDGYTETKCLSPSGKVPCLQGL